MSTGSFRLFEMRLPFHLTKAAKFDKLEYQEQRSLF